MPLAIAVVCAVAVVAVMRAYARRLELAHPAVGAPVTVQVASRALARGTLIAPDMLRAREIRRRSPPGAVATPGN